MKKVLLAYSSREGQTKKILATLESQWGALTECDWVDIHEMPSIDFTVYDQVLIAASIRYGKFNKALYQFTDKYRDALTESNAVFVCINLTARKPGKDLPENSAYIRKFLASSSWQPEHIAIFAGALRYPRYRWFDRVMIQFIMRITGGETDTSKEVEYTDWQKVAIFGEKISTSLSK